jgi:hypothetical protein
MMFHDWLKTARVTEDHVGDLITDMKADDQLPDVRSADELRRYIRSCPDACDEALAVVPHAWRRYRNWKKRHEARECYNVPSDD